MPDLKAGKTVMVPRTATRRAIVKHLDGISDDDIAGLNIPTGIPLYYELDEDLKPLNPGGTYLDPEAAAAPRLPRSRARGSSGTPKGPDDLVRPFGLPEVTRPRATS